MLERSERRIYCCKNCDEQGDSTRNCEEELLEIQIAFNEPNRSLDTSASSFSCFNGASMCKVLNPAVADEHTDSANLGDTEKQE